MYRSATELLGGWVVELVRQYFDDQSSLGGDKLFIKISGIDEEAWPDMLKQFRESEPALKKQYVPIMRTLRKVDGFEVYQCKLNETSTWLRNNTPSGHALVIFMNESSPEAQSLENIFTIDEVRLLGNEGLRVLYKLLSEQHHLYGEELDTLTSFFHTLSRISEPQLRHVLAFLEAVLQRPEQSMVDNVQHNLDKLLLFRDSKLVFKGESWQRLKKNYLLSRLEKEGTSSKKEALADSLNEFLDKEDANGYSHEIWQQVSPEVFQQQALAFIRNQSVELLKYDYEFVSSVLQFRSTKPKVHEKITSFVEQLGDSLTKEQKQLHSDTLEAIEEGDAPDTIQQFIDEFTEELREHKPLRKQLERIVDRLRNLHEYEELAHALLRESFAMLEEQSEQYDVTKAQFELRLWESSISDRSEALLKLYLLQLERVIPRIHFDSDSLAGKTGEADKQDEVSFLLELYIDGKAVDKRKFKLKQLCSGHLPAMMEHLSNTGEVPYFQEYLGADAKLVDVVGAVKNRVSGYIASGDVEVKAAFARFEEFVGWYATILREAMQHGLSSIDSAGLERELESLLSSIHQASSISSSKQIYQYIGCLGSLDRFPFKANEVGVVQTRVVTLLNPIRLLSFFKKMGRIEGELNLWIERLAGGTVEVDEIDDYVQHIQEAAAHLSPHYFVAEGAKDQFLIEQQERMGEGFFALGGMTSGEDQLVDTFAEELLGTVRTYLEVYPYAVDCLDLVFLYCTDPEYVTKSVYAIFRHTEVRKIKALVHSANHGAAIHERLNGWLSQEEQFLDGFSGFPKVEIQVIAGQDINQITHSIANNLQDADIGVLVNYFGQTSHIEYRLDKVHVADTDNWFDTVYKEPLKKGEAVKRISYVSEKLPKVMQYFYQLQYMVNHNEQLAPGDHYLLRNVISISDNKDTYLINFMHERFNWSLFIDRYLDKSLLRQVSSQAQIIKYKSKAGKNKDFRTILSSSKYIRKLVSELVDHAYYDRLYQKYVVLLKNDKLDRQIVVDAMERVKEISGGAVLRAIGPGKFAHELMAMYLATEARKPEDADAFLVWSVCDELPWFQGSQRRPDLVGTRIVKAGDRIRIDFELIELKFISYSIFEEERFDARRQVSAGLELYHNRFAFGEKRANAELWRKELVYYLLEFGMYSVEDALLLKELQSIPIDRIDVGLSGSVDTFVYTSNMLELSVMEGNDNGHQTEMLSNDIVNHIYNRSYILRALGATGENETPAYEEMQGLDMFVSDKLGDKPIEPAENETQNMRDEDEGETVGAIDVTPDYVEAVTSLAYVAAGSEQSEVTALPAAVTEPPETADGRTEPLAYPEQAALYGEPASTPEQQEDVSQLVESYHKKLRFNFNQIGIPIKVLDTVVGVSVIRIILEIPGDKPYSSVENRTKDIQLWLKSSSVPLVAIRSGRINIDINREQPETVYFDNFMSQVRAKFPAVQTKGKLVGPLGVGQLNEIIAMDFSSPDTPHLLIGGRTGSGKSVTINSIILAMMCLYEPREVQFIFIDPKKVEFLTYENKRHTKQVITEIEEAVRALEQLVEEMEQRYRLFAQEGVTSIDQFVEMTGSQLPRLVVVFDEFADFMVQDKNSSARVENAIMRLGAKARAAGIHLLICTQNPKADIVPTNIRNNLPARLALKATDHHASKIILDEEGAEKLGGKGDFLAKLETPEVLRGKSPFLTPRVKRALLQYFNQD